LWLDEACDDGSQIVWREILAGRTSSEAEDAALDFLVDDLWDRGFGY
jgi:hypothetical protein